MKISTQTDALARLRRNVMELYISDYPLEIHPHDAEMRGINEGDLVALASRKGDTTLKATITRAGTDRRRVYDLSRPGNRRQRDHHRVLGLGYQLS
jgi:anaerobic selenocysteine-containing dehydrogenase